MTPAQDELVIALLRAGARDVGRASNQAQTQSSIVRALANEPLTIDIPFPPTVDAHFVVANALLTGIIAIGGKANFGAVACAWSIVTIGTPPTTLAEEQVGINFYARGQMYPENINLVAVVGSGTAYQSHMVSFSGQPIVIPSGYMLRYTMSQDPGTVAPGPGAGSWAQLQLTYSTERNAPAP